MSLSQSFNRLLIKIEGNLNKTPDNNLHANGSPESSGDDKQCRPGSPFVLLMSEGTDEEFNLSPRKSTAENGDIDGFDNDSIGSSLRCDSSGNFSTENDAVGLESSGIVSDSKADEPDETDLVDYLDTEIRMEESVELEELGELNASQVLYENPEHFDLSMADDFSDVSSDDQEDALKVDDERRSFRNEPLNKELFETFFDPCGRLVNEHELRRVIFKGGVEEDIRKDVWQFLFELYPFNSTTREREVLKVEQIFRYEAMKVRWKKLLKELVNDYEGVRYCPKWYSACPENVKEFTEALLIKRAKVSVSTMEEAESIETDTELKLLTPRVMVPKQEEYSKIEMQSDNTMELKSFSLIGIQNPEEELPSSDTLCFNQPSSYDEKLSQVYLLSTPSKDDSEHDVELCSVGTKELKSDAEKTDHGLNDLCSIGTKELKSNVEKTDHELNDCNSSTKIRTASVKFECPDVNDITEALADAMLDVECPIQVNNGHENEEDEVLLDNPNEFNMIFPDDSSQFLKDEIDPVMNGAVFKPIDSPDCEDGIQYPVFPNPFTLPAEYVNNQESLYSKSDNFKSLDFVDFHTLNSEALKKENVTTVPYLNEHTTNITTNRNEKLTCIVDGETRGDLTNNKMTSTDTKFSTILEKDVLDTQANLNDDVVGGSFPSSITSVENSKYYILNVDDSDTDDNVDEEISSYTSQKEKVYTCSCEKYIQDHDENVPGFDATDPKNISNRSNMSLTLAQNSTNDNQLNYLQIDERRQSLARSPTGEKLENLPPWIAQMIKASTPGSDAKPKGYGKKTNDGVYDTVSPINAHSKELLGIVENANRYLQEVVKNRSSPSSPQINGRSCKRLSSEPSTPKAPSVKTYIDFEKNTNGIRSNPVSRNNSLSGTSFTSKFKIISNAEIDAVDNKITQNLNKITMKECPYCNFDEDSPPDIVLPSVSLGEEQLKFMEIQAQVFAARQPYNDKTITDSVRVVDKDVPRTDRELPQFSGDDNPGLVKLRDALLTYAFFHPDVGYAQGMNDIMSRFLVVMDTESEAFWMFVNYMEHFKHDFMEEGMLQKIALVEQLLMKMDRELYDYLQTMDMGLMFCHRWLLLNFKREFAYKEAIRLFEITSSRHLEVSSVEAELERSKARAQEFLKDNRGSHSEEIYLSPEYPFDIFVCVTMLMECRHMIMETEDLSAVYQILSNLPTTLDLQNILRKSEELFYKFCRKTVVDCFQVIDEVELQDFESKKKLFPFSFQI